MAIYKLQSADGQTFQVDGAILKQCGMLKYINYEAEKNISQVNLIPLPDINSSVLRTVLQWLQHHKYDELQEKNIDDWDMKFINAHNVMDLMNAANYLGISRLLLVSCKKFAEIVNDRSVDEVRNIFDVPKDLPREKKQVGYSYIEGF